MNKLLLIIIFLVVCTESKAQKQKPRPRDWFVMDVYGSSWENTPSNIEHVHWKSIGFGLNFMKDIPLGYSAHSFAIGMSYTVDKVHSNLSFYNQTRGPQTTVPYHLIPNQNTKAYNRNKLVTHYVELPLEMRFRTKIRSKFYTYFGVKGGYNLFNFVRSEENNIKVKTYNLNRVQDFRYGPTFRIGFGAIGLYGFYNMNGLFTGQSENFIPFSVGISYLSGR